MISSPLGKDHVLPLGGNGRVADGTHFSYKVTAGEMGQKTLGWLWKEAHSLPPALNVLHHSPRSDSSYPSSLVLHFLVDLNPHAENLSPSVWRLPQVQV